MVKETISIDIAPFLHGNLTVRDLISPVATFNFWESGSKRGVLFKLKAPGYELEAGVSEDGLYIRRNSTIAITPFAASDKPVFYLVTWAPTLLRVVALDEEYSNSEKVADELFSSRWCQETRTIATLPPNDLIAWARDQSILPVTSYASPGLVFDSVVSALQGINDTVETVGMQSSFWDISRRGNKIIARVPKHEPDIQPELHGLIFQTALAKTLEVVPEYPAGGGNLDFLFTAPLSGGGMASVCVEVKAAHSDDLIHGLTVQLPSYMRSKGCNFGAYVVLDFRGDNFDEPKDLDIEHHLHEEAIKAGVSWIRIIVLSLGKKLPPSRR